MDVPGEVLLAATEVVLQWGPEALRPKDVRLRERFPHLTDEQVKYAISEGQRVLGDAEALAPRIKKGPMDESGNETLRKSRPWLSEEAAGHAITQGLYYHWRDTGE